jgi:uncharacterized delta-60 repeat protein
MQFILGAAGICAAVVAVFLFKFNFFFTGKRGAPTPSGAPLVRTAPSVAPRRTASVAGQGPVVPLPFNLSRRGAVAVAQGRTATQTDVAHERFARWAEQYFSAAAGDRAALLAQGKELAAARREALAALIEIDPKRALELAAPWKWREELPAEIAGLLEQRVSGRAKYSVFGAVPLEGQEEFVGPILRYATFDSVSYRAFAYGRRQHQISQAALTLNGIAINDALAVSEDPARVLEPAEAQAALAARTPVKDPICSVSGLPVKATGQATVVAYGNQIFHLCRPSHLTELNNRLFLADGGGGYGLKGRSVSNAPPVNPWTYGPKSALFMRVNFPDDPTEPISESAATTLMNQASDFYAESSFNKTTLIPTITPLLTLPQPKLYYTRNGPGVLMADARQRARDAGYPQAYDRDIVSFMPVPGFNFGGLGAVGASGVWLQSTALGVVCHELGHNCGLFHANFWNTRRPTDLPNPINNPFDIDSLIGFDSIIGAGHDVEYGDIFDTMGSGGGPNGHFSALPKYLLNWIPEANVFSAVGSSTNRLYAHDSPPLFSNRLYLLRVAKDADRDYWVSYRSKNVNNPWSQNGVELHWNSWALTLGTSQLLDTTPGTPLGLTDAALVVGRTFSDTAVGAHITPIARGVTGSNAWIDVVINVGTFPANVPPSVVVTADRFSVAPGAAVNFTAAASDANGDPVAYYWDFGDGTFGTNSATASKSWSGAGDYVVRCEVSDMKGGVTSRHLVVRVGSPSTLSISGRVIDSDGNPLPGVRVHNGATTNYDYAADFQWTFTDSDGRYSLVNLAPATYTPGAFLFGYITGPLNFANPITLVDADAQGADFLALPLSDIHVKALNPARESGAVPGTFQISRTKALDPPLRVLFNLNGTATAGADYADWTNKISQTNIFKILGGTVTNILNFDYVDLPGGVASTNIGIVPAADTQGEGDESVVLTLALPIQAVRTTPTDTNWVFIPGWELRDRDGQQVWFQTHPDYSLTPEAEASLTIQDQNPPAKPVISVLALGDTTTENEQDSGLFLITRFGNVDVPLTIPLAVSGTATPGADYVPLPETVTLAAGETFARLPVVAVADSYLEGNETVRLSVVTNASYSVGTAAATVTIVDNDLPTVTLNTDDAAVLEAGSPPARIVVSRSGDVTRDLVVSYLATGTAIGGRDYNPLPGTVTIPAGAASATILLTPRNDALVEGDETVVLFLADSATYNVGWPNSATVTILDDELPVVSIAATDPTASEPADTGEFTVTRTGNLSGDLIVYFKTGGKAIHQADYAPIGDRVRIPAGARSATITITPIDDGFREDPEPVVIELVPNPAYNLGPDWMAQLMLNDDDGGSVPAVGFSLLSSSVSESVGVAKLVVAVTANPADNAPIVVNYRVSGGTATAGQDYAPLTNGMLMFSYADPTGMNALTNRTQIIPITITDDNQPEPNETIVVTLFDPIVISSVTTNVEVMDVNGMSVTNTVITTNSTPGYLDTYEHHTLTILDNDLSLVSVEATVPDAYEEGPAPGEFTFTRTGATNLAQTVYFQVGGSASSGNDFAPLGNSIVIPAGLSSVTLPVFPVDDPVQEFSETVTVTLYSAPGAQFGPAASATVTIHDNDGTIEFAKVSYSVQENAGQAEVLVNYSGSTNRLVTVDYAATAGTATAGFDFVLTNGTLTFLPGETSKSFFVPIIDDLVVEPTETVNLILRNPSGGAPLGGQNTAVLRIIDDDTVLEFSEPVFSANEDGTNAVVTVRRSGVITNNAAVGYFTADGGAVAGQDYVATNGTLQFGPGELTKTILIALRDDTLFEGDEAFTVALTNAVGGATGAQSLATVVIKDDECALEFDPPAYSVIEYGGFATVNVRRTGGTVNTVRVDFATRDGSATSGPQGDFFAQAGTIEFAGDAWVPAPGGVGQFVFQPGETNKTVSIRINDDAVGERNETFTVGLRNPRLGPGSANALAGSVALGNATNAVVTILDNETPGHGDYEFNPGLGADGIVRSVAVQADGKVLMAGDFLSVDGVAMAGIGRLHTDGYLDSSFDPGAGTDGPVYAVAALADGKVLIGGNFTRANNATAIRLARLNADGSVDNSFIPGSGVNGAVLAVAETAAGRILIGGQFSSVGGSQRRNLAQVLASGAVDAGFNPGTGPDGPVYSLSEQPDGKVLIAGAFTGVNGANRNYIARLNADGTVDTTFNPASPPDGIVRVVALQSDGRIIIGGEFTHVGVATAGGVARLNSDGTVDSTFVTGTGAAGAVYAVATQADGRIGLGGAFTSFNGRPSNRIARLNPDGSLDSGFNPGNGANDTVLTLKIQPDSALVIGGKFTSVDDLPRNHIARVHGDEKFSLGLLQFSATTYLVNENAGAVTFMLRRSGNLKAPCSVDYATKDITATATADYQPASGTVTFAAGESEKSISISIADDMLGEGNESFSLTLTNAVGIELTDPAAATVIIVDDESAVAFSSPTYQVSENQATAAVTVSRSGSVANPFSVDFAISDGTATAGQDYIAQSGTLNFASGETTKTIVIAILNDAIIEGDETIALRLSNATGGVAIGNQGSATLVITDDDALPAYYNLTLMPSAAGVVAPPSGRYPTNSIQVLTATPARGYQFVRWEGTLTATDNPLFLKMTQDHVLTPRFRLTGTLDGFESGNLLSLPWFGGGNSPWTVEDQTTAAGRFAARSGSIGDDQSSSLILTLNTPGGAGSFDFRVSSEQGWDFLEFYLNGVRLDRWSGEVGWQNYQFVVPSGVNQFEWRYAKDANFSSGLDAAFVDNLFVPPNTPDTADPAAVLSLHQMPSRNSLIELHGQAARTYLLEVSGDLKRWTALWSNVLTGNLIFIEDTQATNRPAGFYRAVTP